MGFGKGVGQHNDTKHVGSAKRGGPEGVAKLNEDRGLEIDTIGRSAIFVYPDLAHENGFSIAPLATTGDIVFLANAITVGFEAYCIDTEADASMIWFQASTGKMILFTGPATGDVITWTQKAVYGPKWENTGDDESGVEIKSMTSTITIGEMSTSGLSDDFIIIQDKVIIGASMEILSGGDVAYGPVKVGDITAIDWFEGSMAGFTGTKSNSMQGNAGHPMFDVRPTTRQARALVSVPVEGDDFVMRITVFYFDMFNPP